MNGELTGKQKRFLRSRGHHLKPVVQIGKQGVGASLFTQVEEQLLAHELIKVRVLETSPQSKTTCARALSEATGALLAQMVGHTLLLYRAHPEKPLLKLPSALPSSS